MLLEFLFRHSTVRVFVKWSAAVAGLLLLAGCSASVLSVDAPFDPQSVAWAMAEGTATVSGVAAIDGARPGAGATVFLVPAGDHSRAWVRALFGDAQTASRQTGWPQGDEPVLQYSRSAIADETGRFRMEKVPAGDYFLMTEIVWLDGQNLKAGQLYEPLIVADGQQFDVLLDGKGVLCLLAGGCN